MKVEGDVEGLFNLAFTIKINQKRMKKMEKDYAELKKKEQEEMVELRVSNTTHHKKTTAHKSNKHSSNICKKTSNDTELAQFSLHSIFFSD